MAKFGTAIFCWAKFNKRMNLSDTPPPIWKLMQKFKRAHAHIRAQGIRSQYYILTNLHLILQCARTFTYASLNLRANACSCYLQGRQQWISVPNKFVGKW
jgi:hypothetical protein